MACYGRFRSSLPGDKEIFLEEVYQNGSHKVFLRKRPLFQNEEEHGEFDVITCCGSKVVIHDARMQPDFLNTFIDNHAFDFDGVFDADTNNDRVYNEAVKPLFDSVMLGAATATVRI